MEHGIVYLQSMLALLLRRKLHESSNNVDYRQMRILYFDEAAFAPRIF
jgi:hypothetical protein